MCEVCYFDLNTAEQFYFFFLLLIQGVDLVFWNEMRNGVMVSGWFLQFLCLLYVVLFCALTILLSICGCDWLVYLSKQIKEDGPKGEFVVW